jgi:transcription factor STE12
VHPNPEEAKGFLLVSRNFKFSTARGSLTSLCRFSVPHDRLFLDALERDLKREKMGLEPTTVITGEPALSFTYDPKRSLYEQFCKAQGGYEGEGELEAAVRRADELAADDGSSDNASSADEGAGQKSMSAVHSNPTFHSMFSLFEGSPHTSNDGRRRQRTRLEWMLIAPIAWTNIPLASFGTLLGCQRLTCLWRKPVVSFFTNRGTGIDSSVATNFLAVLPRIHASPFVASRTVPNSFPAGLSPSRTPGIRNTFPAPHSHYGHPVPPLNPIRNHSATLPGEWPYMDHASSSEIPAPASADAARTKVFVCPLFSCGRMYKRMEHLKRHVRSHTMERPFQCHRCNKKFSRQDNLNQHLRIHMRMDAEGVTGTTASYMAAMGEDESAHADVEDLDELEGIDGGLLNIGVCEVEVEGIVHEVEGDEEGLITTNPTGYVAEPNGIHPMVGQDAYYSGSAPTTSSP